jgi:ABC-2 type transport system ATP-binding protein
MNASPAIELHSVQKAFGAHVAVRNLSLTVPRGMIFGVLGPNGAGKTTTIRMIMDILRPDSGAITVLGVPSGSLGLSDRLGYLPEERGLYRRMSVRQVLAFLGALKGVPARDLGRRVDAWLERFDLRGGGVDWGHARVEQLSRGMQQKVQVIATLLHEPELVVLDEPFSGLDPVNAQALKDTMLAIRDAGRTVVLSTHLIDLAERMCDELCVIAKGELRASGTVASIRGDATPPLLRLEFEEVPDNDMLAILRVDSQVVRLTVSHRLVEVVLRSRNAERSVLSALLAGGASLIRVERATPTLHQRFLEHVGGDQVEPGMHGHG